MHHAATRRFSPTLAATAVLAFLSFACSPAAPPAPPAFDGSLALSHVNTQVAFGPRIPGTDGHRRCADWLASELSRHTPSVSRQTFYHVTPPQLDGSADTLHLFNIIASFQPESTRRLTICAHWDSRPWADEDPDSTRRLEPVPGANDGGSGVAVCLELARILGQAPPPFGVDLILFDAEDQGPRGNPEEYLIGSRWFVSQARNYRPVAVILLDMIGDAGLNIAREAYSDSLAPGWVDLVWNLADSLGLQGFVDSVGYHVIDDHLPFLLNGIPALDLIDFDYAPWHTVADTPDKVSAASLETVGRLLCALIYHTPIEAIERSTRVNPR
jgi:hypothetical protein